MLDPCGVIAGFGDMSSENKYAALAAALQKGESAGKYCEHELREGGLDGSEPAEGISIETPMQPQMSDGSGAPPIESDAAASKRGHPDSQILESEYSLRVSCMGESEPAEGSKEDALMPTQLSDGSEVPAAEDAAPAVESEEPAVESEEPAAERDATGDDGDGGMHAKDAEDAGRFDVVMDGEETLQLPAVEFDPEVQGRVGRWAFSTEPGSTAAATDVYMRFDRHDKSGECVIDGHRVSVQLRVHSVANLWARLSGARLLNQIVRLRVIQGGLVSPARENNTCNEAGISTGFERGTLNSFQITIMKLRTTPIRIVIRVLCSCPFNSLRVITVNTKTLAALSHVATSRLTPNQMLRLPAHCEPLFAQLKSVNKYYLRLEDILLVIHKAGGYRYGALITHFRAGSGHMVAEIGLKGEHLIAETRIKGEHLFAETEIKGEHLFAETGIKSEHLFAETEVGNREHSGLVVNVGCHLSAQRLWASTKWQEREPEKTQKAE